MDTPVARGDDGSTPLLYLTADIVCPQRILLRYLSRQCPVLPGKPPHQGRIHSYQR
jgi:hypothetical protein